MTATKTRKRKAAGLYRALALSWLTVTGALSVRAADDPLTRARLLYNQRQFQETWSAADQARLDIEGRAIYQRIRTGMRDEIATHPTNGTAAYWLAASAQAQGDLQAAWDAAQAGWVRAPLASDRGAGLRADLDRLVLRAIVPDRAKILGQPADSLRVQWEEFKERWTR